MLRWSQRQSHYPASLPPKVVAPLNRTTAASFFLTEIVREREEKTIFDLNIKTFSCEIEIYSNIYFFSNNVYVCSKLFLIIHNSREKK